MRHPEPFGRAETSRFSQGRVGAGRRAYRNADRRNDPDFFLNFFAKINSERFKTILTQQTELKAKRAELEQQQAEDAELTSHMELAADTLEQAGTAITEWDEYQIRALVESVRILSKEEILVRLKSGIEKVEKLRVG